jgi:hypothetical protein
MLVLYVGKVTRSFDKVFWQNMHPDSHKQKGHIVPGCFPFALWE